MSVGEAGTWVAIGDGVEQETSVQRSTAHATYALGRAASNSFIGSLLPARTIRASIAKGVFAGSEVAARGHGRGRKNRCSTRSLDVPSLVPPAEKRAGRKTGQVTLIVGATNIAQTLIGIPWYAGHCAQKRPDDWPPCGDRRPARESRHGGNQARGRSGSTLGSVGVILRQFTGCVNRQAGVSIARSAGFPVLQPVAKGLFF